MQCTRILLAVGVLLAAPLVSSSAYQPPAVTPGSTIPCIVRVNNDGEEPLRSSAQVRLRGSRFWGSPRQQAVRGAWAVLPEIDIAAGETLEWTVDLAVPDPAPPALDLEIRTAGDAHWTARFYAGTSFGWGSVHVEDANLPAERARPGRKAVPFRVVAEGVAPAASDTYVIQGLAAHDADSWDDLRAVLRLLAPDSWNLHPAESDPVPNRIGYRYVDQASASAPDMAKETVLAVRTPMHTEATEPRALWIRSVERRWDGSVVCRYSHREKRIPSGGGGSLLLGGPGHYTVIAIPKTDAPVRFRRVP